MEYLEEPSTLRQGQSTDHHPAMGDSGAARLAERVINILAEDRELTFYDKSYPSSVNPGAYVSVRICAGTYFYRHARHGWRSRWKKVRRGQLIQYIESSVSASDDLLLRPFPSAYPVQADPRRAESATAA
jgi:hypothetical protein